MVTFFIQKTNSGTGGGAQLPSKHWANEDIAAFTVLNSDTSAYGTGELEHNADRDSNKGKQQKLTDKRKAKQTVQLKTKKNETNSPQNPKRGH
jgi:hypothetical protein